VGYQYALLKGAAWSNQGLTCQRVKWYLEEILFSLKHYWRFVDCEALELTALSQRVDEEAA